MLGEKQKKLQILDRFFQEISIRIQIFHLFFRKYWWNHYLYLC
nr:MAG TPA: hypothetical protein [Caudoviricetes sp.]